MLKESLHIETDVQGVGSDVVGALHERLKTESNNGTLRLAYDRAERWTYAFAVSRKLLGSAVVEAVV